MLSHAVADMKEIARADMDVVVHMLSHTDWERHDKVMGDIFRASEDAGLEVWVDNWGIGGGAGDKAHFLVYHPEAHTYYGNGNMQKIMSCLNAPAYRQFVKDWVDKVAELGARTVFWDEPSIPKIKSDDGRIFAAAFNISQDMLEELPLVVKGDVKKVEMLDENGNLAPVEYEINDGVVTVKETVLHMTPIVLVITL